MNELISIIVPIYNAEDYLKRCIESLLNQTYSNIEIILVNDGSTDNSLKICEEYLSKDKRIKIFSKENSGVSDTRNYGLNKASGEYISFVDSDDWLELDFYEYLYCLINKNKDIDIACVQYSIGENILNNKEQIVLLEKTDILMDYYSKSNIMGCIWNKLYRKNIVTGTNFDKKVGNYGEDVLFLCKILCKTNKLIYSNIQKYHYNVQNTSISRSALDINKVNECIKAHEIQIEIIREKFPDDICLNEKALEKLSQVLIEFFGKTRKRTDKDIIKIIKEKIRQNIKIYEELYNSNIYLSKLKRILRFGKIYYKISLLKEKVRIKVKEIIRNKKNFYKKRSKD